MYLICFLTAWSCQGAHNGPCDSLGWQRGDFAFSASFLILNEIMPPGLVLEAGGTSTLQAAMPVKLKSPPTSRFQVGGTSALQAWLPAKLKSPPLQAQVRGGSRWADLAVYTSFEDTSMCTF